MNEYMINQNTLALIPISNFKTKILEKDGEIFVEKCVKKIIEENCKYFGSSYEGRLVGTKNMIGVTYKAPIIIEESREIIIFPTSSPRFSDCIWLSLDNIKEYFSDKINTTIIFNNNKKISLDISYFSLDNQISRSIRLNLILKKRKLSYKM